MTDLLERFEVHFALDRASPGFHFSTEDMAEIIAALHMTRQESTMTAGSIGAHRVRETFNPSKIALVDKIKRYTADLIDLCEDLKRLDHRLAAIAQTTYEEAAMWAVKAATTTPEGVEIGKREMKERVESTMAAQGTMADLKQSQSGGP